MPRRVFWMLWLLWCWLAAPAMAAPKIAPWMMADWENPAPHLADANLNPKDVADSIGQRLMVFPHAPRDITLPAAKGPRRFANARFVSAVARVDLPAATLRRRLQDFANYRSLFPLFTESEVMALDARKVVARYRMELPLPALATIRVDFRIRHNIEADGSVSALLIDGRAESLIAMLGGMTDELADQPVVSRWEVLPISARQSLMVFTYWDRVELKSFFARKVMEAYPELKVVGPYMVAAGAGEAIHRNFVSPLQLNQDTSPPGMAALSGARYFMNTLSVHGPVVFMDPEFVASSTLKPAPLRYATVATRIMASPEFAKRKATQYARFPDFMKEVKDITVDDHGKQVDLGLEISAGVLMLSISLDLDVRNTWVSPERLEFRRTRGNLAQLRGSSEWYARADTGETLMLTSAAHEVGEDAPLLLRLAHRIVESVPYGDTLGGLVAHMVVMERMRPWIEAESRREAP